jgi:hypothetical protein
MQREARIAGLEARLAELEPYRTFVEQMRAQMQREEQGRFGDLPSPNEEQLFDRSIYGRSDDTDVASHQIWEGENIFEKDRSYEIRASSW